MSSLLMNPSNLPLRRFFFCLALLTGLLTTLMSLPVLAASRVQHRTSGTLSAWGYNAQGQTSVPAGLTDLVQIAGGIYHSLALKSDGTVVAWGWNDSGQATVPVDLTDVAQIAGGYNHSLALYAPETIPPVTTASLSLAANADGWNNASPVTVTLSAEDEVGGSGVASTEYTLDGGAAQNYTGPFDVTGEGAHTLTYRSTDNDGNEETDTDGTSWKSLAIQIDATAPTITATATNADTTAYTAGTWTDQAVTVHYTCSDGGSGLSGTCPADETFTTAGTHSASQSVSDLAGNSATSAAFEVKIDATLPSITLITPADGSYYLQNEAVVADYDCSDTGSDISSCAGPVADGAAIDTSTAGEKTFAVTATDAAGNTDTTTVTYTVVEEALSAAFVSQSVPSSMVAGQRYLVYLTMRNTGTVAWSGRSYGMDTINPHFNSTWGVRRLIFPAHVTVQPGQEYTFGFYVTAPSTLGTHNFQWRMLQRLPISTLFGQETENLSVEVNAPVEEGG